MEIVFIYPFLFLTEAAKAPEGASDERFLCSPQQLPGGAEEGSREREGVCGQSSSWIQGHGEYPAFYLDDR